MEIKEENGETDAVVLEHLNRNKDGTLHKKPQTGLLLQQESESTAWCGKLPSQSEDTEPLQIHTLTQSLTQQMFIGHLLCTGHIVYYGIKINDIKGTNHSPVLSR